MMTATVVAVALGLTPVDPASGPQSIRGDYSNAVGRYSERVDRRGTRHLSGYSPQGSAYDLTIDRHGNVEANVGDRVITFHVREAS